MKLSTWKQILNQKKKYFILWLQLFIMFIILFYGNINLVRHVSNLLSGVGCETENVQFLELNDTTSNFDYLKEQMFRLQHELEQNPAIESVSLNCNASPYIGSSSTSDVHYGELQTMAFIRMVDHNFGSVLNFEMLEGSWFTANDTSSVIPPVIICKSLAEELYANESPIGKLIRYNDIEWKIQGVISHLRRNDYEYQTSTLLVPITRGNWNRWDNSNFLFKLKEGQFLSPKALKSLVYGIVSPEEFSITESALLDHKREKENRWYRGVTISILMGVGFMVFNIMLGLIGIVSYSVNSRISELGIRRAMGSTKRALMKLIFSEMLIVSIFALIAGLILILNLNMLGDELRERFYETLVVNSLSLIILVILSAAYPAWKASKTEPALALKED